MASGTRVRSPCCTASAMGIRWTVDTWGWKGAAAGQTADSVVGRVLGALRPGEIVLMHVGASKGGSTLDADALPGVIAELRAKGYAFATVTEFIRCRTTE